MSHRAIDVFQHVSEIIGKAMFAQLLETGFDHLGGHGDFRGGHGRTHHILIWWSKVHHCDFGHDAVDKAPGRGWMRPRPEPQLAPARRFGVSGGAGGVGGTGGSKRTRPSPLASLASKKRKCCATNSSRLSAPSPLRSASSEFAISIMNGIAGTGGTGGAGATPGVGGTGGMGASGASSPSSEVHVPPSPFVRMMMTSRSPSR